MTKKLHEMSDEELSRLFPVVLESHNLLWASWYECQAQILLASVDGIARIHHYGSTSIPDIIAKPTIDILIEIARDTDLSMIRTSIESLGYIYMHYGIEPHMMFVKGYTEHGFAQQVYHIHVHYVGVQDAILFRDYLIYHPTMASEYERLKLSLQKKYEYNRDAYTDAKSDFIRKVVALAKSTQS